MSCDSCRNEAAERNKEMNQARITAKKRSNEEKTAIAICKELSTGEIFCVPIYTAIENRFAITEVISEL